MASPWPPSNRNGGRLHVGTAAGFRSVSPAGVVGIRTGCQRAHEAGQFGAVGASPADLLAKDLLGPCSLQLGDLGIEGLTVGRDAGVAVDGHGPEVWRARREAGHG